MACSTCLLHLKGMLSSFWTPFRRSFLFSRCRAWPKEYSTSYAVLARFLLNPQLVLKTETPSMSAALTQKDITAGCFGVIHSHPSHNVFAPPGHIWHRQLNLHVPVHQWWCRKMCVFYWSIKPASEQKFLNSNQITQLPITFKYYVILFFRLWKKILMQIFLHPWTVLQIKYWLSSTARMYVHQ